MTLDRTAAAAAVTVALEQQHWFPLDPGNPGGVRMATLWGDPARGPFAALSDAPGVFVPEMPPLPSDEGGVMPRGIGFHGSEGVTRERAPGRPGGTRR